MSEEILQQEGGEGGEQVTEQVAAPVSKYVEQAQAMGWRPKEEWAGDPEDFVEAKEYVQRKSFFDKISTISKENKELKETLDKFKDHYSKVEEHARKAALAELKSRKKAALEEGDADAVVEIDEAIADFKIQEKQQEAQKEAESKTSQGDAPPELVQWRSRNSWFGQDPEMTTQANALAMGYKAMGMAPIDILDKVEKDIKKAFKEKFTNPNKAKATAVESAAAGAKSTASAGRFQPSDEERKIAAKFVKSGLFKTADDYYSQLQKLNKGE